MDATIEDFLNSLKGDTAALVKTEFLDFIKTATDDSNQYIKEQAEKIEKYTLQLAQNEINANQFKELVLDLKDLLELDKIKQQIAIQARTQRLIDGIENIVIEKLFALIIGKLT